MFKISREFEELVSNLENGLRTKHDIIALLSTTQNQERVGCIGKRKRLISYDKLKWGVK